MKLSPDIKWALKIIGGTTLGVSIILPVELGIIEYYKQVRPAHYHIIVDPYFSPQYDVAAQAAAVWVETVHDRTQLDITMEMGECPAQDVQGTICLVFTHALIDCPPIGPGKVGCTAGSTCWVDTQMGADITRSIIQHELGHSFGIADFYDPYPGVMNMYISTQAPRHVMPQDVRQYLRFHRKD